MKSPARAKPPERGDTQQRAEIRHHQGEGGRERSSQNVQVSRNSAKKNHKHQVYSNKIWLRLQEKRLGLKLPSLILLRLNIQSDVFSLDNYITRSKVEQTLKSLALTSTTSTASNAWRQVWDEIHRLKGKIELFYHHFYNHMGSAEGTISSRSFIWPCSF